MRYLVPHSPTTKTLKKQGDIMEISKNLKITASIISVIGVVFGAAFFVEDRYEKVAAAREMKKQIEKDSVETFQQQQEYTNFQILDILKYDLRDIERRLEKDPNSIYLKNQLDRLKEKIKRLEDKLYK